MKLCECGCGREVQNRFVRGHNSKLTGGGLKIYHTIFRMEHPDEYLQQLLNNGGISVRKYGGWFGVKALEKKDPEKYREMVAARAKKAHETMKREKRGFYDSKLQSELGKRGSAKGIETLRRLRRGLFDPKFRGKGLAVQMANPEKLKKDRTRAGKLGGTKTKELGVGYFGLSESQRHEATLKGIETCRRLKIGIFNPNHKSGWDEENRERQVRAILKGLHLRPNRPEQKLIDIIKDNNFPFVYVGDGKVVIERFCPDFIDNNGSKRVIEVFGDYWHRLPEVMKRDERRLATFGKYGFKTLVIWESELKDEEHVVNRIKEVML